MSSRRLARPLSALLPEVPPFAENCFSECPAPGHDAAKWLLHGFSVAVPSMCIKRLQGPWGCQQREPALVGFAPKPGASGPLLKVS